MISVFDDVLQDVPSPQQCAALSSVLLQLQKPLHSQTAVRWLRDRLVSKAMRICDSCFRGVQTPLQLQKMIGSSAKLQLLAGACGWQSLRSIANGLLSDTLDNNDEQDDNTSLTTCLTLPVVVQLLTLVSPNPDFPEQLMRDLWRPDVAAYSRLWLMQWLDVGFHGGFAAHDFMLGMRRLLTHLIKVSFRFVKLMVLDFGGDRVAEYWLWDQWYFLAGLA
jgi:hypothetical protein